MVRSWTVEGLGVIERSEWSLVEDIRAGRLIRLLEDWSLPDADVVAILNPKSIRTARVDAFLSHLAIVGRDLGDEP